MLKPLVGSDLKKKTANRKRANSKSKPKRHAHGRHLARGDPAVQRSRSAVDVQQIAGTCIASVLFCRIIEP